MALGGLALSCRWPGGLAWSLPSLGFWLFCLSFFRDPERTLPPGDHVLVSPADGKVTEITEVDTPPPPLQGRAVKVGIFLSVFNVHVNRAPLAGKVIHLAHQDGKYLNALDPASARENERQDLALDWRGCPVLVRQIAGAIARRIVCKADMGQDLARGERYGMIKFGSRAEIYVPAGKIRLSVRLGQTVKGGETVIGEMT